MPDISMCDNKTCPMRFNCKRHAASGTEPEPLQTYGLFTAITVHGETTCSGYWPVSEATNRMRAAHDTNRRVRKQSTDTVRIEKDDTDA